MSIQLDVQAREWSKRLARYREPSTFRSIFELAITLVPFVAAWASMVLAVQAGHVWLFALLVLPTAGLVVRMFMIQHDCGHGAFFAQRAANDWTGRLIGILTLTPYDYWRHTHAVHHASAGNLDRRGVGDVATLTVDEYLARSWWGRFCYRLYRHPAVMFGLGPTYLFVLQHRLPLGLMHRGLPWLSTVGTTLTIVGFSALLIWLIGPLAFLVVHVPVVLLAATAGVWLFYVQHQFEATHWSRDDAWSMHEAALHGSSHYDLPPILRWFTANIGIHHIHHLCSRIPYYRLTRVLRDFPQLRAVGRVTLRESFRCVRLVLWDGAHRRLISFKEMKRRHTISSPA